jgi:hypothetical protein
MQQKYGRVHAIAAIPADSCKLMQGGWSMDQTVETLKSLWPSKYEKK